VVAGDLLPMALDLGAALRHQGRRQFAHLVNPCLVPGGGFDLDQRLEHFQQTRNPERKGVDCQDWHARFTSILL
jgi:hypothetical protein